MWGLMIILFAGFIGLYTILDSNHHKKVNTMRQMVSKELITKRYYKDLAKLLEIQADGGDKPADFVGWVIKEIWKDADKKLGVRP